MCHSRRVATPRPVDILVTGIPRSGTSYLCSLLDAFDNCVAINEPPQFVVSLAAEAQPTGLVAYGVETRRRILAGEPVANKLRRGKVTTDTAKYDKLRFYKPTVQTESFVLAVKNTASVLARLDQVIEVLRPRVVLACVRNPYDSIASWRRSFRHLRDADVGSLPVANPGHPWILDADRSALREIASSTSRPMRAALLWKYFAEALIKNRGRIVIVPYPALVAEPLPVIAHAVTGLDLGTCTRLPTRSEPKARASSLSNDELMIIRRVCGPAADCLGVANSD